MSYSSERLRVYGVTLGLVDTSIQLGFTKAVLV